MDNKGFAISGILYTILVIFVVSITIMLFNLQNRKTILDEVKLDAVEAVNMNSSIDYLTDRINKLEEALSTSSNVRYNEETDMVQIYHNNEWVDWKKARLNFDGVIFEKGNSYLNYSTNGFTNNGTNLVLDVTARGTYYYRTTESIDFSNYTKLNFQIDNNTQNNLDGLVVGISDSSYTYILSSAGKTGVVSLDLESIGITDGYIYIRNILSWNQSGYSKVTISKIWFS